MLFATPPLISFQNGSIGPAWPDISRSLGSGYSPPDEHFDILQKTCFSGTVLFWLFLRIACQNDLKKCPYRHIGSSQLMPCRLFVVFSPTLFLNDPTMILPHFLMLADQGAGKKPARKHLNPFWWHIVKKQPSKTHLGAKITKNRSRLRSKWTTWPPTQLRYFSLDAPLCDTWAPRSQKTGSRHTNLPKSTTNGPP